MRVSKDPNDKAFSETAGQRRVWSNDREILNWVTADEFRRVVITDLGQVLNGPARIERLPEDAPPPPPASAPVEIPADVGFVGAGLVFEKPVVKNTQLEIDINRPGDPDGSIEGTPSEWLPESDSQD